MRALQQAALAISVLALSATAAYAHPKLVSSTPAAEARVVKPTKIEMVFTESLAPDFSTAELVMPVMAGMTNHKPMVLRGAKTAVSADGKTLTLTPPKALGGGSYTVNWRVVSIDTHRAEGSFTFTVE
jgi:methionine-rich copper-binding protein CopC